MAFQIVDSLSHWGPSLTLDSNTTTAGLLKQMKAAGVGQSVVAPFSSTAAKSGEINVRLLNETRRVNEFIPCFHMREDLSPAPRGYLCGSWHRMRSGRDGRSNYGVLGEPELINLIDSLTVAGKPVIFEEELAFGQRFAEMADELVLIIPNLGMTGGYPIDFLKTFKNMPKVCFNTALSGKETILKFVETIGPERLLFASHYPFGSMAVEASKILSLPIKEDDKALILGGNILRLTGAKAL